jgi:ATP-dependent RNA helicase RhlE
VLDEADMMFDMGFAPQIEQILKMVPQARQTMLFSATMPPTIMKIIVKHMSLPINIEVAPSGTTVEGVIQEMIVVKSEEKIGQLEKILKEYSGSILVFLRTKYNARKLCHKITQMGYKTAEIHSNRSLAQRREALGGFKNGRYRVLVATDIAARGIDVSGIELVVNYDLPDRAEDYVHRIGRTGRAGKAGRAISFVMPAQLRGVRDIERLIKKNIPLTKKADGIRIGTSVREEKITGRREPENRSGKERSRNFRDNNIVSVFNSFKQTGGGSRKKFGRENLPRKYDRRPGHSLYEKRLTDKQRFKRSINPRFS